MRRAVLHRRRHVRRGPDVPVLAGLVHLDVQPVHRDGRGEAEQGRALRGALPLVHRAALCHGQPRPLREGQAALLRDALSQVPGDREGAEAQRDHGPLHGPPGTDEGGEAEGLGLAHAGELGPHQCPPEHGRCLRRLHRRVLHPDRGLAGGLRRRRPHGGGVAEQLQAEVLAAAADAAALRPPRGRRAEGPDVGRREQAWQGLPGAAAAEPGGVLQ
mmetsp:Transcript_98393/g.212146  ORF Transcript_98393/g.212146 Transcript_98393/m.212146 type:complete len:216 (-) Transcript_98393:2024-2671(-)